MERFMHRADIKAALEKKGYTLTAVDKEFGFKPGAARDALRTGRPSAEKAIAKILNIPPYLLFPSRFNRRGSRLDRRSTSAMVESVNRKQEATTTKIIRPSKKEDAA
jgi:Ner family transcriptional regulator